MAYSLIGSSNIGTALARQFARKGINVGSLMRADRTRLWPGKMCKGDTELLKHSKSHCTRGPANCIVP
jgi:hypothetical protein